MSDLTPEFPILIVAAQPTLDHTALVPEIEVGKAHRVNQTIILPSGKAINTARSLKTLGAKVRVAALLAGYNGRWISEALKQAGVAVQSAWMGGENRIAYSVYDPSHDTLTEFIEDTDGPVTEKVWAELHGLVQEMLPGACALILTGRAPRGAPDDGYKRLVDLAHNIGIPVFIDCYGPLLQHAMIARPELVKINQREAGTLMGKVLHSPMECAMAAQKLYLTGIPKVIITLGDRGAVAINANGAWLAVPPKLHGAAIGSGDALLAGVVYALVQQRSLDDALRWGVAAGAANVLTPGAGVFNVMDAVRISQQVRVMELQVQA